MPPEEHDLGPLEMRVVGIVRGEKASSVQAVQEALARSGHELAYTTVLTVVTRLHEKGVLIRTKEGRRYLYSLAKNTPAMSGKILSRIKRALFPSDRAQPILELIDSEKLSTEELRALRRKIDTKLRGRS